MVLLSVKTKRRDEMVRVQFSHAFDRCDEFWIILEDRQRLYEQWRDFCSASFEGGRKGGAKCDHLLDFWVELAQKRPQQRQSL